MEKKEKWIFIVNPTAGGGHGKAMLPELNRQIDSRSIDAEVVLTERHGHASDLSELYLKQGYTHIIAVGGDGTMNEVAKPLIGNKKVVTGLIPAGTGNDFIQILGFAGRFDQKQWDQFFGMHKISMDVGKVNQMHFLNGMGLGFDAQVAAENYVEPGEVAKGGGKGKYIWHILKTLLFYRESRVKIESRSETRETDCFINTISIISFLEIP